MRLPLIKHIHKFIEENDEDFIEETVLVLEHIADSSAVKDEELDAIGELLSNLYGALEVHKMVQEGQSERDALNGFMQQVLGSIDT